MKIQGTVYWVKQRLVIPTLAQTTVRFFLEVEPVHVLVDATPDTLAKEPLQITSSLIATEGGVP